MASKKISQEEKARQALAQQLREARFCAGLTQAQLAKVCGVGQQWMGKLLTHPEKLTMQQWRAINSVLHLDPAIFNAAAGFVRGGFVGIQQQ